MRFSGSASVEVEADSVESARRSVLELDLADIARAGYADILSFDIATREITESTGPGGGSDADDAEGANRPRPSGWYRPG
jgi:hypothetical protein